MRRPRITPVRAGFLLLVVSGAIAFALVGRSSARASSESPTAAIGTAATVNHFKCYPTVEQVKFNFTPPAVRLRDQFYGSYVAVGRVTTLCNPVKKTLEDGSVTPIGPPENQHLICWSITERQKPVPRVFAANQFGDAALTTGKPATLCVPSLKRLERFTEETPIKLDGLDHFKCYGVSYTLDSATGKPVNRFERIPKSGTMLLDDQFDQTRPKVGGPRLLCNPVEKHADPDEPPTTVLNTAHLVCFSISETLTPPATVYGRNQFGVGQLGPRVASLLCLPSRKDPIGDT